MKTKSILIAGSVIVAVAAVVFGLKGGNVEQAAPAEQVTEAQSALTVSVAKPDVSVWPLEISASGWIRAWQEAVISSEIGGQKVTAVNADVGDMVHAGDVLVELSRETIENNIRQLEASLDAAKAALEQASSDADRARQLSGSGSGTLSQQQTTEYLVAERKAQADVASAEAQLDSARLDLDHTRITAITDGLITSRSASLGDVLSQGTELFRMIRDNRIEWQAEVPLKQVFALSVGTRVAIPTPIGEVTGHIRQISPVASDTTGRVTVYVALDPMENAPEPMVDIMINGVFKIGETEALNVPSSAVVMQDGFSYVFIINPVDPATVLRERVETGRRSGDRVEVSGEFDKDALVVQSGGAFLSDGSTVTVVEGAAQ